MMATSLLPDAGVMCEVIDLVTSIMLDQHAIPVARPDRGWPSSAEVWVGSVGVSGTFRGVVTFACTRAFMQRAARTMLAALDAQATDELARDVLAELTNVLGGNLKSLLEPSDEPSELWLAVVALAPWDVPDGILEREQWCECDGELIALGLWRAAPEWVARTFARAGS